MPAIITPCHDEDHPFTASSMSRPAFAHFAQQYFAALLNDFGTVYQNEPIPRDPKLRVYKYPSRSNFGSALLGELTAGNDRVMINPEVVGEANLVDVLFEPDLDKSRTSLGLLGELLFAPAIIETLRWTPDDWAHQTCLSHWLRWKSEASGGIIPIDATPVYEEEEDDDYDYDNPPEEEDDYELEPVDKILLMLMPTITPERLEYCGFWPSAHNIPGVYSSAPAFCTTIVATNQLPQDESTLWLRLLGRGPTQRAAIAELLKLDTSHPHRNTAIHQLQQWQQLLSTGQMGRESQRLMAVLSQIG
jgi:hypothetical protein